MDDGSRDFATRLTEHLYTRFGQRLYCTAHFLLPRSLHDWCYDLVHETFAEFLTALRADRIEVVRGIDPDEAPVRIEVPCRCYLLASLEHRCRDVTGRWNRHGRRFFPSRLVSLFDTPEQVAERAELRAMVRRAVEALPGPWRRAVVLCHLEGYRYQEAADRLGIPLGTLQSRLSRACRALHDRLDGVYENRYGDSKGLHDECHEREWSG